MEKRVVITGLGVISSVGNDIPTFWNNLLNGVCGIQTITDFPTDGLPVKIGGRVKDFDPDRYGIDKAPVSEGSMSLSVRRRSSCRILPASGYPRCSSLR